MKLRNQSYLKLKPKLWPMALLLNRSIEKGSSGTKTA